MTPPDSLSLGFHMAPIQHQAMTIEHPALFRSIIPPATIGGEHVTFYIYAGSASQIARLLEVVRDWQRRPATPEQLRDILGEDCA